MPVIKVHSAIRDYDVNFSDTYDFMGAFEKIQNRFYVIDSNVWALYRDTQFSHLDRLVCTDRLCETDIF